jgi:uncharacterized Zn-binding protein involved in type VI secretion
MPPAARISDMHTCPMLTAEVPHVGGPIVTGFPTVEIGFMPAARISDIATCVGPPDTIVQGATTVLIGYQPAARIGDATAHGGVIVSGFATVLIGESGSGGFGGANTPCGAAAQQAKESRAAMWKRKGPEKQESPSSAPDVCRTPRAIIDN